MNPFTLAAPTSAITLSALVGPFAGFAVIVLLIAFARMRAAR